MAFSLPLSVRSSNRTRKTPLSIQFALFLDGLRRDGVRGPHEPIRVVHLDVLAEQLLLALLVGQVPSDLVAVLLGLQ